MKKISICTSLVLLASLAACSEGAKEINLKEKEENTSVITTTQTTTVSTTSQVTTKKRKEIKIDNLDNTYDCDYYSFKYPKEWELKVSQDNLFSPRLIINNEAYFSISAHKNPYFTKSFDRKPTNDDYIDYISSNYGYYDKYVPEGSIGFVFTEEDNQFYHSLIYCFYSYDFDFEIWFETDPQSDFYYPQDTIDKVLKSFTLHDSFEPYPKPETTQLTTATQTISPSFSGHGDAVTDVFSANGCTRIKGEYSGENYFNVTLYDAEGNYESMVFSNVGQYNGEKVFKFENDKQYMFEVSAKDGEWKISVE